MKITNSKRIISLIVVLATFLVVLFSNLYIADHINHACVGNDCEVCAIIQQCSSTLKKLGMALIVSMIAIMATFFHVGTIDALANSFKACSLISQKVRLNN